MSLTLKQKQAMGDVDFTIYVTRAMGDVLVGRCALDTIKKIHAGVIDKINFEARLVYLDPSTSYGR